MEGNPRDTAFAETWQALGLPETADLAHDATITPRTLALARGEAGSGAAALREAGPLPRLTISYPEDAEVGAAARAGGGAPPGGGHELEVQTLIGEGGMGRVFLARQRSLAREVAIKTVHAHGREQAADALCAEAVVTGLLEHPNVIPVHALGADDAGRPLLVMKRVEGVSWRDLLHDPDHPGWRTRAEDGDRLSFHLEVLGAVAQAVAFAHSRGVVHRDVKPENVMIGEFGEVYALDWGLAVPVDTQTPPGTLVGTPAYMAPEMIDAGRVDARTDVYLLGACLHEVLVGHPPHGGTTLPQVLLAAHESAPPTFGEDVPRELADACRRAMARAPGERFPTASAFRQALVEHQRHRGSLALTRKADALLEELRARAAVPAAERDLGALLRVMTECRFGYHAAREGWPENPRIAEGLDACLALAARIDLDRRDAESARAHLGELAAPPAGLADEVAALEAELGAERTERARLEQLAKDADQGQDAPLRAVAALSSAAVLAGLTVYALRRSEDAGQLAIEDLLVMAGLVTTATFVALSLFGRRVLTNEFNRRLAMWVVAIVAVVDAHRVFEWWMGGADTYRVFVVDALFLSGALLMGGIFLFRFMLWLSLGMLAAAALIVAIPSACAEIFGTVIPVGTVAIAWLSYRQGRESRDPPRPPPESPRDGDRLPPPNHP